MDPGFESNLILNSFAATDRAEEPLDPVKDRGPVGDGGTLFGNLFKPLIIRNLIIRH